MKKLFRYLFAKKDELRELSSKDAMLAKVVVDIHRKRTHSTYIMVPLFSIRPIHAIDRESAVTATQKRVAVLQDVKDLLLAKKDISRETLAEYLPSVSGIKVVKDTAQSCIAYEGNGRLAAMQEVFTPEDEIFVEVEEYCFADQKKIIRRMNRVRRMNGLR